MRIRTVKPEFWRRSEVAELPMDVRLLLIGLASYVDDNGVGLDDVRLIAADLFPFEPDPVATREWVSRGLASLSRGLLLHRYQCQGRSLVFIPGWDEEQRVDRPSKPRYPRPPDDFDPLTSANHDGPEELATPSRQTRDTFARPHRGLDAGTGNREQGTREQGSGIRPPTGDGARDARAEHAPAIAPAREGPTRATRIPAAFAVTPDMLAWAREKVPGVNLREQTERFIDYWNSKAGREATKRDWTATWRNWMRTAHDRLPVNRRSGFDESVLGFEAMKDPPPWELRAITGGRT